MYKAEKESKGVAYKQGRYVPAILVDGIRKAEKSYFFSGRSIMRGGGKGPAIKKIVALVKIYTFFT